MLHNQQCSELTHVAPLVYQARCPSWSDAKTAAAQCTAPQAWQELCGYQAPGTTAESGVASAGSSQLRHSCKQVLRLPVGTVIQRPAQQQEGLQA